MCFIFCVRPNLNIVKAHRTYFSTNEHLPLGKQESRISNNIFQVCKARGEVSISKRSTTALYKSPKAMTLTLISRKFPNHAPTIITEVLHLTEDSTAALFIETTDAENDTLVYQITKAPEYLDCDIHNTSGKITCTPEVDFYGLDYVTVKITETGLPQFEEALFHEKTVRLNVTGTSDKTDRYFIDSNGTIYTEVRPSMIHIFTAEANRSSDFNAGTILLADVDGNEVFAVETEFVPLGNSTHILSVSDSSATQLHNVSSKTYRSVEAYDVRFKYSKEDNGNMSLKFIAKTAEGHYTPSVTIELYILQNPCVFGHCSPRGHARCDSIDRATSFVDYMCVCDPGYEDEWCQTEINECKGEPCALMFDCEDLINAYQCNINIPKLMAILICSIIAVGGASFLMVKLLKRFKAYRVNKVGPSR